MDLRVEQIFFEEMKGDTSFQAKSGFLAKLFGSDTFTSIEMRKTWHEGIKLGIEIGLRRASVEGQIIEVNSNTLSEKNKEFLEKFYKLSEEYKCAIQYHPEIGMVVLDQENKY